MPTVKEMAEEQEKNGGPSQEINENMDQEPVGPEPEPEPEPEGINLIEWIKTPTGPGPVEQYLDSPLNFDGTESMARILRGLTGFVGDMDFAIVDIIIGTYQKYFTTGEGEDHGEPTSEDHSEEHDPRRNE